MGSFLSTVFQVPGNMKIFIIAMLGLGLSLAKNVRKTWTTICDDDSGNQCCTEMGGGMASDPTDPTTFHEYKIVRSSGLSWSQLELQCKTDKLGARLAVFESQRENDCVTKYLLDEYEDSTAQQYAIGLRTDDAYKGVYLWDTNGDLDDISSTMAFQNWISTAPTGLSCVTMTVGLDDLNNGRWTDVDCGIASTLYGICEYTPPTTPPPTTPTAPPTTPP